MATLLIFVGRTEANRAYKHARYRFDDGVEIESKLYAAAVLEWMRRTGRAPDRLLMVGTATSGWDVLMELVERIAPAMSDQALDWAIPVSEALASGAVGEAALRDFESRFSQALGLRVELALVRNDGDSVFETLDASLAPKEKVVLDITHSFRSMPVHALVALGAMRWLKGVELVDIVYGSLDEKDRDGISAARSLGPTARLARATPALAQLALVDDVGGIAPALAEMTGSNTIGPALADTQRLESIMQFDNAGVRRGQALGELRNLATGDFGATTEAVAARTRQTLESMNQGRGPRGLVSRARRALDRDDFMRAVGLANEALAWRAAELRDLRQLAEATLRRDGPAAGDLYRVLNRMIREELARQSDLPGAPSLPGSRPYASLQRLNAARNAVMHAGTSAGGRAAPEELYSAEALRSLLEWSFRFYDFLA